MQKFIITKSKKELIGMVAYFCHHLSDYYVDLSDLYVDLSVISVDLSDVRKISSKQVAKYLISYPVNATNCHLLVSLISDKSTSLSDKST